MTRGTLGSVFVALMLLAAAVLWGMAVAGAMRL